MNTQFITTMRARLAPRTEIPTSLPVPHWSLGACFDDPADAADWQVFSEALRQGSNLSADWLWLAATVRPTHMREYALQRALYIDPACEAARDGLNGLSDPARLAGRIPAPSRSYLAH